MDWAREHGWERPELNDEVTVFDLYTNFESKGSGTAVSGKVVGVWNEPTRPLFAVELLGPRKSKDQVVRLRTFHSSQIRRKL